MEWTLVVVTSVVSGGLLWLLAAGMAVLFPRVVPALWWSAAALVAGVGAISAGFPGTVPAPPTALALVATQLAAWGTLRWVREAGGSRSLGLPILLGLGTIAALGLLSLGIGAAATWIVGPPAVTALFLGRRAASADQAPLRAQAQALLNAWLVGWLLFSIGTAGSLWLPSEAWSPALAGLVVVGTALTLRALHRLDPRFHPTHSHPFVLEKTQDAVLFLKADGTIHAGNPALKPLLDYEEPELVGRPLASLGVDDEARKRLAALERLTFPDWEGTLGLTQRSGRSVPVHLVFRRVHNPAREAVGAVLLLYDLRLPRRLDLSTREDQLTSLSNRRWVLELLEAEFQRVKRYGGPLSALWLEVVGADDDEVLRRLGAILRGGLRKTDFCGRVGTHEFLAVLPETVADRAEFVGRRLEQMFALAGEGEPSEAKLRVNAASLADDLSSEAFVRRLQAGVPTT